ncbi:MAG: response regulator [Xanthobacteraceae bacterium]
MSKRILVVEDQPDNRQIIGDMLAPTDYEITEAENGEEALAAITKQRPDPYPDGYPTADHGCTGALQPSPAVGEGLSISDLKPHLF